MRTIPIALCGLGSVNRQLLKLLSTRKTRLAERHGVELRIVWAADSSAIRRDREGFAPDTLDDFKGEGGCLRDLDQGQLVASDTTGLSETATESLSDAHLMFEATPVDLETGGIGAEVVRASLEHDLHVVLANKGPLVRDYAGIMELANRHRRGVGFSATVCGGLPIVNIGRRDFPVAEILSLRGIFNSTTNFILDEMRAGRGYREALEEAQRRGIAETNPRQDVEGYDTAAKLVILANAVLGVATGLEDVSIQGITKIPASRLFGVDDTTITKLIATATGGDGGYRLSVEPKEIARDSFLGRCESWEMGVEIETDIYGHQFFKIWEREPLPTAAAMLRDAIHLLSDEKRFDVRTLR